jgi:K+-transporting ATPase A subunit
MYVLSLIVVSMLSFAMSYVVARIRAYDWAQAAARWSLIVDRKFSSLRSHVLLTALQLLSATSQASVLRSFTALLYLGVSL